MSIAIIGAMEEEVALIKSHLEDIQQLVVAKSNFFTGRLKGKDIVLVQSGIGKANAAMTTTILLERFQVELIINIGAAGALDPGLQIGDVVIAEEITYSDVDATVFNYVYGQVPQMPASYPVDKQWVALALEGAALIHSKRSVVTGLVTTEDSFIGHSELAVSIRARFPESKASDMEGAAIAQTAYQFGVPFFSVRGISDNVGAGAAELFTSNVDLAAKNSAEVVEAFLTLYEPESSL
ncbi:5'-methylthioadenosine/adenosylhomocysteine nucleosidase [Paenibacillus sp. NPDC058177]|uniref:5'-methylthioadenosine/adenosylhomocysteine nucleosidase n=1 Tax=Paenibacillus sp. NPDC058177 TaxID=3346369 RepID=UPI0036DCA5B1